MPSSDLDVGKGGRATLVLLGIVYALLTGLLLLDLLTFGEPRIYPPRKQARTVVEIAEQSGRERAINPIIAFAAREVGGEDVILEIPEDYANLLATTPDNFAGQPVSTLNPSLMVPFIGSRVREVEYDPVLPDTQATSLESDARTVAMPRDVWTLEYSGDVSVVRLYTDSKRTRVYVVPVGVVGEGVE